MFVQASGLKIEPTKRKYFYIVGCAFEMSNVTEPIVISSGEESDEVIIIKEIPSLPDKNEMDVKSLETMSNFRLSNSKLKALKSRKRRDELRTSTNNVIENRPCEPETPVIKSSPKLQIDPKKLKKLKAVVKIERLKKKKQLVKL